MDGYLARARASEKRRFPKILHKPGDKLNRVFNFIMSDSYMQPHFHPDGKIEEIWIVAGKLAVIFFDDKGTVTKSVILEKGREEYVKIPAFAWHTYVVLSDHAVTYETMVGVYDQKTWKDLAGWAPPENAAESKRYFSRLKEEILKKER